MEVSYLVGIIKKEPANTSVRSRSLPGFLTSFSFVTHTQYKHAYFATATAPKICSGSYFLKEPLSVNIEKKIRRQIKNSRFFYFTEKSPSGIKTISKFRSA